MNDILVRVYRAFHKRCRTCIYAEERKNSYKTIYTACVAKNKHIRSCEKDWTGIKGVFCGLYVQDEMED